MRGNTPIQAHGPLGHDKRMPGPDPVKIGFVQPPCLLRPPAVAGDDADAGRPQQAISLARYLWVRILYGIAHLGHSCSPDGVGAGRRAPVVAAGFQRHVERCATRPLSGSPQGYDLGMGPTRWLRGTL